MTRRAHEAIAGAAALAAVWLAVSTAGCAAGSSASEALRAHPTSHRFDVARAYALVRLQLSYGPRPAGSAAERRVAEKLVRVLPGGHFEAVPGGLRNIVGGLPGREPAIVLAAHYDTTPLPGYLGANNSAAGVAAVVEIARELARTPSPTEARAVRFLLTDGEEAPPGFSDFYAQGDRGSKAYLATHRSSTREVILLDFIALRDEQLPREADSTPSLWARMRAAARKTGVLALFPPTTQGEVLDDHTPFLRAGIPAIDLIDFDYPCWQKRCDNLSQVSPTALDDVGEAVRQLVESERLR